MLVSRRRTGEEFGMISSRNTTTPRPPMKCVDERQKSRLRGSASTSSRMVAPVVVKPDTLSNQALAMVNGPPHSTYGSMPNRKDSSQDRKMIMYPSLRVMLSVLRTKMKGKMPTVNVSAKLIRSGARALSPPSRSEMPADRSMNSELTRSAIPVFRDMTFRFIRIPPAATGFPSAA